MNEMSEMNEVNEVNEVNEMKGQEITPWTIYNNHNYALQKSKIKVKVMKKQSGTIGVFPSIKRITQGLTVVCQTTSETRKVQQIAPKTEQKLSEPAESMSEVKMEPATVLKTESMSEVKIEPAIGLKTESVDEAKMEEDHGNQLQQFSILAEETFLLKMMRSYLTREMTSQQQLRQSPLQFEKKQIASNIDYASALATYKQASIERMPEIKLKRIHEVDTLLSRDRIKLILNRDVKSTMVNRMEFMWKNRTRSRQQT